MRHLLSGCLLGLVLAAQAFTCHAQTTVTKVYAGFGHTLFVNSSGSLSAMGLNDQGQLGNATTVNLNVPEQVAGLGIGIAPASILLVAAQGEHTLFIESDGTLWGMGENSFGELGFNMFSNVDYPVRIEPSQTIAVATGYYHSIFIKRHSLTTELWVTGLNDHGQLGDNTTTTTAQPKKILSYTPPLAGGSPIFAVAAGYKHSLFMKADGSLWAMGYNAGGQLGDGSTTDSHVPKEILAIGVSAIAAAGNHSFFIKSDGSLWTMGDNFAGEMGTGTLADNIPPTMIVPDNVAAVFAENHHTLFIKSDGSLWAMGENFAGAVNGVIATDSSQNILSPICIVNGGVISAAGGDEFSLFVTSDGSLWGMGENASGALKGTNFLVLPMTQIIGPVIANGGFETHDFLGWSGNGVVTNGARYAHSGTYGVQFPAPGQTSGGLLQNVPTTPGTNYLLSFWLNCDGTTPSEVLVWWNGTNLMDRVDLPNVGWTNLQFRVYTTGTQTPLEFDGNDSGGGYFGLDDISVTASAFAPAQVTLSNLSQTYDGTAKNVSASTTPSGLAVGVTYNGVTNVPVNAGSYTVVGTIDDPNYFGSVTNTLIIAPAPASVTLGKLLQSSDGTAKNVSVTTVPPGLPVGLTYNGIIDSPTNSGNYLVIATVSDPNYQGAATNTLIVAPGLTVDILNTVRTADARWLGVNTAIYDKNLDTSATSNALQEAGIRILRFPGGSLSDQYDWGSNTSVGHTGKWASAFTNFVHLATNAGAQAIITVNYGSGTSNQAAAWVLCANVTNHCGFKYWEVGNECYGPWETDLNTNPPYAAHDPVTYAIRFKDYYAAMKAADPTIKVGLPGVQGEDSFFDFLGGSAENPRTGEFHYGWTPIVLSTLQSLGVTPDFISYHYYPQFFNDNDANLLSQTNWAADAADLRQQLSDYLGLPSTNIELVCTENNNDSGDEGVQSTSIVNALYLADGIAQVSKTEFNAYVWWDLRNGATTNGTFGSGLYGWRTNGDEGLLLGSTTRYPMFYTMKLMQYFAQPGDIILDAGSSDPLLPAYAAHKVDGSISVLVINKDPTNTYTRSITLGNYTPNSVATVRSYGTPQDEAARTNAPLSAQNIATNSVTGSAGFSYSFSPYSVTLFTVAPEAPILFQPKTSGHSLIFYLNGQSNVSYVVEASPDLKQWIPVQTNRLPGGAVAITNLINPGIPSQFLRAKWLP